MSDFFSDFGSLWIDRVDAVDILANKVKQGLVSERLEDKLRFFIEEGYIIFENVVPAETIDEIVRLYDYAVEGDKKIFKKQGLFLKNSENSDFGPGMRMIDIYALSKAVRDATFPNIVSDFINAVFEEPAIATQSISFNYGSGQSVHQDTAYVLSQSPLALVASWLALEDIQGGTGELSYYPKSHRFDDFLFEKGRKRWIQAKDGVEKHHEFLKNLHDQAKVRDIPLKRFTANKGDVLIWHADLAHGGTPITKQATRRSLVTHFVPLSIKPSYVGVADHYFEYKHKENCYFSSRHYDMSTVSGRLNDLSIVYPNRR